MDDEGTCNQMRRKSRTLLKGKETLFLDRVKPPSLELSIGLKINNTFFVKLF